MKTIYLKYIAIITLIVVMGCNNFDSFVVTEKPFVNQKFIQLFIGEHAGDRTSIQLTSSPIGVQYLWTSQDPSVVTVDQTGLVKAVGTGITSIIVSSGDDQTVIDVNVKEFIPVEGFTLSVNSIIGFWQNTEQVFVTYIPDNATDTDIKWNSSNMNVATVYSNGLIKMLEAGRATITAKCGDIEQTIDVWVPTPPVKMDKSGWSIPGYDPNSDNATIGYSSQQRDNGGGILSIIDDDLETFWHARHRGTPSNYPHWFIIDLGEEVSIVQVGMARRIGDNRGQKGYQIYTCTEEGALNLNDPISWAWEDQGDIPFDSNKEGIQIQSLSKFPVTRYIKVYIADKYRGSNNYAMIADFSVYITE